MDTNITAPTSITPNSIATALRRGDGSLCAYNDRHARARNGLVLVDGRVGQAGMVMYPARDGGGYATAGIPAPAGCEWVQAMRGCPAHHAKAVLIRVCSTRAP